MSLVRRPQHVLARGLMILALTMLAATAGANMGEKAGWNYSEFAWSGHMGMEDATILALTHGAVDFNEAYGGMDWHAEIHTDENDANNRVLGSAQLTTNYLSWQGLYDSYLMLDTGMTLGVMMSSGEVLVQTLDNGAKLIQTVMFASTLMDSDQIAETVDRDGMCFSHFINGLMIKTDQPCILDQGARSQDPSGRLWIRMGSSALFHRLNLVSKLSNRHVTPPTVAMTIKMLQSAAVANDFAERPTIQALIRTTDPCVPGAPGQCTGIHATQTWCDQASSKCMFTRTYPDTYIDGANSYPTALVVEKSDVDKGCDFMESVAFNAEGIPFAELSTDPDFATNLVSALYAKAGGQTITDLETKCLSF